jgi:RNA polymerase-binding transcription factor DksA
MQYMEAMQDKSWQDAFAKHVTGDDGLPLGYETLQDVMRKNPAPTMPGMPGMPGGKLPPVSGMPGMPGMPPGGAGVPNFDPSKLDPKTLAKLTQLREQVASGKADPQASMQELVKIFQEMQHQKTPEEGLHNVGKEPQAAPADNNPQQQQAIEDSLSDGTSVTCPACGDVVSSKRLEQHRLHWCTPKSEENPAIPLRQDLD